MISDCGINEYCFPESKSIVVSGDIHGDFNMLINKVCVQYQMQDTLIIVAGDCGFGFENKGYYDNIVKRNAKRMNEANNWIVFVRGNHDNPAYFDGKAFLHKRFMALPDYSIVKACDKAILCIGGAISIDRKYRMNAWEEYVKKHRGHTDDGALAKNVYWTDEAPMLNMDKLRQIKDTYKLDEIEICEKIDGANSYPSLYLSDALPNGAGIVSYLYQDDNLKELIKNIVDFKSFDENMISDNNSFMQSIISDDHRSNCLTACQKCLMSYNNRGFHHVLDWRLGVGILRLMLDKNYNFGFIEEDRKKYEELKDWDKIVEICFNKLHIDPKNPGNAIIYHPLWKINDAQDKVMYNTFKLLRSDLTPDNPEQTQNRVQDRFARRTKDKESSNGTEKQTVLPANDNVADNSDDDLLA